jgi:citronellyl-CoA dehydrogenase
MQQFQKERIVGSIVACAAADRVVRLTAGYLKQRHVFGKPLIAHQWIQFKMAELATDVEMLRLMCYRCADGLIAGEDVTREASMAKLKADHLARLVADVCMQFHGGLGYMEEYPIARYYRDARLLPIGAGADEVMLGIIARCEGFVPDRREKSP